MSLYDFIEDALRSNTQSKKYEMEISESVCKIVLTKTSLNIIGYKFIIEEQYVRHIRNNHPDDLYLLSKLSEILNNADDIKKSLTRNAQTGKTDISLVFRKTFEDGAVQMVALRLFKDKTLSLKTFFRP
jgi:hypothetical protein